MSFDFAALAQADVTATVLTDQARALRAREAALWPIGLRLSVYHAQVTTMLEALAALSPEATAAFLDQIKVDAGTRFAPRPAVRRGRSSDGPLLPLGWAFLSGFGAGGLVATLIVGVRL